MCEHCRQSIGHHPQCPRYEPPRSGELCFFCGEEIAARDRVYRQGDKTAHVHCFEMAYQSDIAEFCSLKEERI